MQFLESEDRWCVYDDQETETLVEIADLVWEALLSEMGVLLSS